MMGDDWGIIKQIGGGLGALVGSVVVIYRVWIAYIQRDRDKVVEVRMGADGSKQLTIKGFCQQDESKIVSQFTRNTVVDLPPAIDNGDQYSLPKVLKS